MSEKEVFELWKEIDPSGAFSAGLKEYAGQIWIPSHANVKNALSKIKKLEKTKDPVTKKFLGTMKRELLLEEPQDPPGAILSTFFAHLVIEGIKDKHMISLAEQGLNFLGVQQHLWTKKWPIELQIYTSQECDGANMIIEVVKKKCKKETKEALTALQTRLKLWKKNITKLKLKRNDYKEIAPLLKRSKGLGRKRHYRTTIKELYDYTETPEEIEKLALSWIKEELPMFNKIKKKLAKRYGCKATVEEITKALDKYQKVPTSKLIKSIGSLRKVLEPLAEQEWVKITPKYKVKVIETPKYLEALLPTAAMEIFNGLKKNPFCIYFATTNPKASPAKSLPNVVQTTIHEEYGHCVHLMNSHTMGKAKLIELLGRASSIKISEGLSFHRELESINTFERMSERGAHNKVERAVMKEIEKYCPFEEFVDGVHFVVAQWRMVRFLRAISDVRLNLEKQTFPKFIDCAHIATHVTSYDIREDCINNAKNNLDMLGINNNTIKKQSLYDGIDETDVDLVFLDVPEPWHVVKHTVKALKTGAFLVSYSPTVPQVQQFVDEVNKHDELLVLKTTELIERPWVIDGRRVRPNNTGIGHSGFMTFVRKIKF